MRQLATEKRRLCLALLLCAGAAGVWLAGCSANDPFDPATLENARPVARLAMTPVDTTQQLSPTSYFNRTFNWSATDEDGWVTEFYVSIRNDATVPAPWDTTARTDTTMTFETDPAGEAEATFLLACRDNRGALSDTLVRYIPLRNFPPAVNFQSDFDPLRNMQREYLTAGGEVTEEPSEADTTRYWNWGPSVFRLFALDLDGQATMDSFYRYTLVDPSLGDPDVTFLADDPDADPALGWVKVDFPLTTDEVKEFEIFLDHAPVGENTTLTVSVGDEAAADTRFRYSWEVREPGGPVLYVPESATDYTKDFYRGFLDDEYGEGNYAEYDFWFGYPDNNYVLIQSMRKFQLVVWAGGGAITPVLQAAAANGGVIAQYLFPLGDETPGKLLLVAKDVVGNNSTLSQPFQKTVLGLNPSAAPVNGLEIDGGRQALGLQPHLPALTAVSGFGTAIGLQPWSNDDLEGESIYQMEYCLRCYSVRPPYDPVVGVRYPSRAQSEDARVVTIGLQLEYFDQSQAWAALSAILSEELGVSAP